MSHWWTFPPVWAVWSPQPWVSMLEPLHVKGSEEAVTTPTLPSLFSPSSSLCWPSYRTMAGVGDGGQRLARSESRQWWGNYLEIFSVLFRPGQLGVQRRDKPTGLCSHVQSLRQCTGQRRGPGLLPVLPLRGQETSQQSRHYRGHYWAPGWEQSQPTVGNCGKRLRHWPWGVFEYFSLRKPSSTLQIPGNKEIIICSDISHSNAISINMK